jgi:cell division protein FtsA
LRLSLEVAEKIKLALSAKKKKITKPLEEKRGEAVRGEMKIKKKTALGEEGDELDLADLGILDEKKTVSRKTLEEGIIRPRLNEIFTMVGMEVEKSGAGGLTPSGLVLTGGGAQTIGAVEAAKRTLSMPVRLGIPQEVTGLVDDILLPDFATSLGLVLYGAREGVEPAISFSLSNLGKTLQKIPVKGIAGKAVDLVKSLLP